eukprot:4470218-Amphidinium_carterae.1
MALPSVACDSVAVVCWLASLVMPWAAVAASALEAKLVAAEEADMLILSAKEDDHLPSFSTTNCVSRSLRP